MRGILVVAIFAASVSPATVLFSDNFDSFTSLSLDTNWATDGSAQIVADPLYATNNVIDFTADSSGGDLFSQFVPYPVGQQLLLSFDFLELDPSDPGSNPIAYVGTDHTDALPETADEQWILSTVGGAYPEMDQVNITYGVWNEIGLYFVPYDPGDLGSIVLKLEQAGSGTPGTAFFDNISLQIVPEPVTGLYTLAGLLAFAFVVWRRERDSNPR
jgi:hypothetical protein